MRLAVDLIDASHERDIGTLRTWLSIEDKVVRCHLRQGPVKRFGVMTGRDEPYPLLWDRAVKGRRKEDALVRLGRFWAQEVINRRIRGFSGGSAATVKGKTNV